VQQQQLSTGVVKKLANANWPRRPVGFPSGASPASFDVFVLLRGKKRLAQVSFAAMAPCGRPTRMVPSWPCWRPRLPLHRQGPGEHYVELTAEFGTPYYTRIDAPATPEQKSKLQKLSPDAVKNRIWRANRSPPANQAPGNHAPIGGLKVVAASGWLRPGPPARRTSTRSTPRASRARSI